MNKIVLLLIIIISLSAINIYSQNQINLIISSKNGEKDTIRVQNINDVTFKKNDTEVQPNQNFYSLIKGFELFQNFPNPFNPSTTIKYQTPKDGNTDVKIFNSRGQLVRKLVNEFQKTGFHSVIWDGMNDNGHKVSTGVFICYIKFNNVVLSKKMLLIK